MLLPFFPGGFGCDMDWLVVFLLEKSLPIG